MKTAMQVPQVNKQSLWASELKSMKLAFLLCLLFGVLTSACSKEVTVNNSSPANLATVPTIDNRPAPTVENAPSPGPKDKVFFDGKNYIKKSGWTVPTRKDAYIDESYEGGTEHRYTVRKKRVDTTTIAYLYRTPWVHSELFQFENGGLDSLKGTLESVHFLMMSANGRVFFYSISAEKIITPPPSNSDPHEDPLVYQIMDSDGDGIFETLMGKYDEIVVPDWVLK